MAELLGDRVLPESVVSARRRMRARFSDLREPLRSRRSELVPGPDIIGRLEDNVTELRTRVVRRDGLIERIRMQRGGDSSGSNGSGNSGDDSSGDSPSGRSGRGDQMV